MTTNIATNGRSMSGVILISDGNGTEITEGGITTNDINSGNITTNQLSSNAITCLGVFRSNTIGQYSIPTLVSSETGSLISYGNTSNSGATDFTNYGSTYNTLLQGFRFWNLNSTQTLFNLAIIDNTQTYFKSQLTGCTAETPLNPTSVVNKTFVDNNFMFKTGSVAESINGFKTFSNRVDFNGGTAIIVGTGTTLFNGVVTFGSTLFTTNITTNTSQITATQNIFTNNTTGIINIGTGQTTGTLNIGSMMSNITNNSTTTLNGINTFNAQTTFNNSAPISNISPTLSTHLTTKNYTDMTFQTISNMTNYVDISTSQSISGIKTFNSLPICSVVPTSNTELTNKLYVDNGLALKAGLADNNTFTGSTNTFNSLPICSVVPTSNSELTNKLYVDNAVSGGSLLTTNNTWTGTNLFNNAVSMANTLTFSAATININSSTTTHATNLFSLITSGTQNLWSNLSNNSVVNFFSSATSNVNLNINAKVKFRQVKLYNQVKIITGGTLVFPLEENILINSAVDLTITLPVITSNSLGLTFNFIKNNLLRIHTFTAQGTDTIIKNGFISGSTSQVLMNDGITSFQLVILEMVSGSGLYNWTIVNSSLPQTISNPIGSILTMSVNTTPPGYLLCDGTSYSTTSTYIDLFNVIGYTYGGSPASTFKVPDFRGIFLRGSGINGANANYVSSNIGTIQNDTIKAHSHDFTFQVPNNIAGGGSSRACEIATTGYANTISTQNQNNEAETRPANYAVVYFIKY